VAINEFSSTHYRDELPEAEQAAVRELIRAAAAADRISPVSEDARLALAHGRPGTDFLLARGAGGEPAGYAFAGPPDEHGARTAELVVVPESRRRGLGAELAAGLIAEAGGTGQSLEFWAHGDSAAARRLAASLGYQAVRELRRMTLSVAAMVRPEVILPPGTELRTFRPGADDEVWLGLNARAFSHHPEQGSWTAADLAERMAEPWFDPAGFFLLLAQGEPVGFHWTKVHPAGDYGATPVGEVYVVGIDPGAQGHGYGRLLTVAGINHLADSGLTRIVLYVDADNTAAVRLYDTLGFRLESADIMYAKPFG
jgi:mycothiol synthase